ncbi:MAG: hypothetical protein ACHQ2Z_16055 [Elusimicrobiota bacterium]
MTSRLPSALILVAALALSARADDAQTAAAAMQAMAQAGVATGGAPAADAHGNKKKDDGGFARPLSAPQILKTTDGAKKHGAGKKGADAKTNASRYKSRELSESEHAYRFDENGEPLNSAPKKKSAAKTKKAASAEPDEKAEKTGACASDAPCAAKSADADAF